MAQPVVNNFVVSEIGYTGTNKPAGRVNFDLYDANAGEIVDATVFQYVHEGNKQDYVASNTSYLTSWNLDAYQSDLYVRLSRQGSTDSYIVQIYNDAARTELVASGAGDIDTTITLSESEDSGISGTVYKNSTQLTAGGTTDISLTDDTVWQTASIVSGTKPLTSLQASTQSPGRSTTLYWDILTDLGDTMNANFYFRIKVRETDSPNNESYIKGSGPFAVLLQVPIVSIAFPAYTNQRSFEFDLTLTGTNVTLYRAAETEAVLASKAWSSIVDEKGSVYFDTVTQETKTVYVEVSDGYYNRSEVVSDAVEYHTDAPSDLYLKLIGSTGSNTYTGVEIDSTTGKFTPTDLLTINMYATDLTDLQMYIDGNIKDASNVRTWIAFDPLSASAQVRLDGTFLGNDTTNTVSVTFKDLAGNTNSIAETIRYNSKIYEFPHQNLREPTTLYDHQVMETSSQGNNIVINRTEDASSEYVRKWEDVFYPDTHSYPTLPDGTIDETAAKAMGETSDENYDAVDLSSGEIVYDSEGRVTTVDWTKDGTKDYDNLESSYEASLRYWIIDNTGYSDFKLTFEHFYVDSNSYGPPYNNMAPYDGDCLVIYDASAPGAVSAVTGSYGRTEYTLLDSSKLEELLAYTGTGNQVYSLQTGRSVNANTNGGFTTSEITTTSTICIILYTDAAITESGFKIKAGPKHEIVWQNFNVDEENGLLWVHKYPLGNAPSTEVKAIYDYYETKVTTNYEDGSVTFDILPSGDVTADYTYYEYSSSERPQSRLFASDNDDFVDFLDIDVYTAPSSVTPNKTAVYVHGYPDAVVPSGKVTQNFTVDKDRGLIEFINASSVYGDEFGYVPKGRLFADYQFHSFLRLSNDGYGNFTFADETLVADDTPQYPDYTFGDVKFVNEGDAILEDGKMKFLPRGYDNDGDGTVDQVLDINRPWDIQQGTAFETYNKCAVEIRTSYTWAPTCSKSQARTILSNWQGRAFGFDVYPEQIFYGRIAWVLGGTSGSSYPTTTTGEKVFSSEVEGKYYNIET